MKKVLAVFLSVLVIFSTLSIVVMADETDVETTAVEETSRESIKNEDGLVVPGNMNQLKSSVIFKIFEKIISFILGLFGEDNTIDSDAATKVDELGSILDERLSDLFA